MRSNYTFKIALIPAIILTFFIAGCFVILSVNQPSTALGGEQVTATVTVSVEGPSDDTPHYGIAGFLIPDDWSVSSASFTGGGYTDNMSFLHPDSSDKEPGGQVDYWTDSLEARYPSGDGYKWVVYQSDNSHLTIVDTVETIVTVVFNTSETQGAFNLGYFVSDAALDFSDPTWYSISLDHPITISGVIPVELTSFAASAINESVLLKWETATETNNKGFEIERSTDKSVFSTIGFVSGNGTKSEKSSYSFIDKSVTAEKYYYRLKQIDYNGAFTYSDIVEVDNVVPAVFNLSQNYPNPFNPSTTIKFGLPVDSKVTITIYNTVGENVGVLTNNNYSAGTHSLNINVSDLSSGTYIYSLSAEGIDGSKFQQSNKMILMK
jgi:hypothetical protein